jgi:hypothetical protein
MKVLIATLALASFVLVGCEGERTGFKPPCGKEGRARIDLGRPLIKSAGFTTTGGDLYFTAYDFGHGAVGQPDIGSTRLYVGRGQPKGFPTGRVPDGTLLTLDLVEDDFVEFELEAGSYWVITVADATLALVSCEPDGVTAEAGEL